MQENPSGTNGRAKRSEKIFYLVGATIILAVLSGIVFSGLNKKDGFDPRKCMREIPREIEGLKILSGPRTEKSIIRDMVPIMCNAQVLAQKMNLAKAGSRVLFRVEVEYTGETARVGVEDTSIKSDVFLKEVSDFIMDADFISWARHDEGSVFLYPINLEIE